MHSCDSWGTKLISITHVLFCTTFLCTLFHNTINKHIFVLHKLKHFVNQIIEIELTILESCQMHVLIYIGTRRKRLSMFQDETENTERRRSSRIIALEEKKQEERGRRKMVSALPADNNFANRNNRNKEKGKAKIDVDDHLDDSSEDKEHGPTKKGRKSKALQQLISSTKVCYVSFGIGS